MAAALTFTVYEYIFVIGDGSHNGKHRGAILPDSLRWLWKDCSLRKEVGRLSAPDVLLKELHGGQTTGFQTNSPVFVSRSSLGLVVVVNIFYHIFSKLF